MKHLESLAQEVVVTFLHRQYPQTLFTGGLAGERLSMSAAVRRKRMGYRSGTPDLLVFEARKGSSGLAIEMKAPEGGKVSPEQKAFLEALQARNWTTAVCHGSREAIEVIRAYMDAK